MDLTDEHFVKTILQSVEGQDGELIIKDKHLKKGVVPAGINYVSEIAQLDIEYTKNGVRKNRNFILKIFSSVATYQLWESLGIYDREIEMYKTVLPPMAELLNEQDDSFFPKVFQSIYADVMVLEDLKSSGYVMMSRAKQLNFEHAATAIKTVGKFHALSLRLKEKSPETMDKVKSDILYSTEVCIKLFSDIYESSFDSLVTELRKITETCSYVDSLVELKSQIFENMKGLITSRPNRMELLNHGDLNLNNMMFKHDGEGNVIAHKLIDFQVCRWTSPAIDIWYFLVLNIPFNIFSLHFDSLIAIYWASLNDTLEMSGSSIRYTFSEIKKEIDDCAVFGIFVFIALLPGMLVDPSKAINVDEMLDSTGNFTAVNFLKKSQESISSSKILAKWFLYFNERKLKNMVS